MNCPKKLLLLLTFLSVSAVLAAPRADDMRRDAEITRKLLDKHGSFDAWSQSLHADREAFRDPYAQVIFRFSIRNEDHDEASGHYRCRQELQGAGYRIPFRQVRYLFIF